MKKTDLLAHSNSVSLATGTSAGSAATAATRPAWTINDKIEHFRRLPPVLCPPSPPPLEVPSMTEDEARIRSRQRIERLTRRLASLPLYQARHLINLVSTQLRGPFGPGSKYWGMAPPATNDELVDSLPPDNPAHSPQPPITPIEPLPALLEPHTAPPNQPPQFAVPALPTSAIPLHPSSTVLSGPLSPATPPPAFPVDLDLVPAKTSTGRPLVHIDYDRSSLARSPTPTPSMPPPSRMASQVVSTSRPPETPASQRAFVHELTQASVRASGSHTRRKLQIKSPKELRKFPVASQTGPRHSTPARRPRSRATSEQRISSPLMRFGQQMSQASRAPSKSSQPAMRFSQEVPFPQRESIGEEFYNSQLDFDHQIQDITAFMEGDIGS